MHLSFESTAVPIDSSFNPFFFTECDDEYHRVDLVEVEVVLEEVQETLAESMLHETLPVVDGEKVTVKDDEQLDEDRQEEKRHERTLENI